MTRPSIPDPATRKWLYDEVIEGVREKCRENGKRVPNKTIREQASHIIGERIQEYADIWIENNREDCIEDFDNDEDALRAHAETATAGNLYENFLDELIDEIYASLSKPS